MEKVNLDLECDYLGQVETSYQDTQLRVSLKNVNVDNLISELLDNVDIESILMQIDPISLVKEVNRKIEEDKNLVAELKEEFES